MDENQNLQKELQKYCDNWNEQRVLFEYALTKAVKFYQNTYEAKYVHLCRGFAYKVAMNEMDFSMKKLLSQFVGHAIPEPSIGITMPTLDEHIYAIMYDEEIDKLRVCLDEKVFNKDYEFDKNNWEIVRNIFNYIDNPQDMVDCMNEAILERFICTTGPLVLEDEKLKDLVK